MFNWCVVHLWQGQENVAKFDDYYEAQEYAARWKSYVLPYVQNIVLASTSEACLNGNSNMSLPLSTTGEAGFSQQDSTATLKPTP